MKDEIRILHVLGTLNRGGAQLMIMNIYQEIDRKKIQFDFVVHTPVEYELENEIKNLGGRIYRVPRYTGKNHLAYKKAWKQFLEKHPEYRIIHGHVRSTAAIYLKIAKKYGLTTIAHSHSTSSGRGLRAVAKNVFQYPIKNTADYLLACSQKAGEWLFGKNACNGSNFFILNNAVDTMQFAFDEKVRIKKRVELSIEDKFVVGHIGRFQQPKNHIFLVDIFKEIYKINENSILLLIGDGELRQEIEQKVEKLGLSDNVIFAGVRSDISELLQAMDVFLFPSIYEGLPVTLIEAQAAGLPCVISDSITKEVVISPSIKSVALDSSIEHWVDIVLSTRTKNRQEAYKYVAMNGYDVKDTSNKLASFYIDANKQ